MRRQTIAWRLGIALGFIVLAVGIVSSACVWALIDVHRRLHAVKEEEARARVVMRLASALRDQYAHVAHTIIIGNDSHASLFREASSRLGAVAAAVRAQAPPGREADQVDRIILASKEIDHLFERQVLPLVRKRDQGALAIHHDRILHLAFAAQAEADDLTRRAEGAMEDLSHHARAIEHGAIVMTVLAQILSLATVVLVGLYLYRSIARPVAALSAAATRVGTGDLEINLSVERDDELGRLARRFNDMARAVKEQQAELVETERLAAIGRLAAGIAHEINNPVGVILGYTKLLRRRTGDPDPKMLAAIEEEAERCRQVVEGLLELTRGIVVRAVAVELTPLIGEVVEGLRLTHPSPEVPIEIRGRATAMGDGTKLRQILTNLIGNAVEACGDGGHVVIEVARSSTEEVSVHISDTGEGVAPALNQRIFEPFFTTKPNGTGLGLAISRAIARAHGGDVMLVSTGGSGATFRLTLPASAEPTK